MSLKKYRLGIMGGSFNPPHIGHIKMTEAAAVALNLHKVMFIPSGKIVYKSEADRACGTDRYNMLKTAIDDVDDNEKFCLSDIEINQNEITYTANTLRRLNKTMPDYGLYFIVGADSLIYMEKWYKPEEIFSLCTVAAIRRCGIDEDEFMAHISYLRREFGADISIVDMPNIDVSSSMVRRAIRQGENIDSLCSQSVVHYIKEKNLYS